jgi:hypothetical protein
VNALANPQVGEYVNEHFASAFLKVGTFTIANGNKQGGNVATYFCLPDGSVLNAIAGPVDAQTMLREARWAVETRKLALFEAQGDSKRYKEFFRKAHGERVQQYGGDAWRHGRNQGMIVVAPNTRTPAVQVDAFPDPADAAATARFQMQLARQANAWGLDNQGKVQLILSYYPLVKIEQVYKYVFERILNERVSTLPVVQN